MWPSPDLVGLVGDWFAAASRGDRSLVNALVSRRRETLLVGSDASEIVHGGGAVVDFLVGEVDGAAAR